MPEIKRIYRQTLPKLKLIGRCYSETDKVNGTYSEKWNEWFKKDLFSPLLLPDSKEPFEDCNAYIGLCRCKGGEPFQYRIGVFVPDDFAVPEGYDAVTLEAGEIAVVWVYGREPELYSFPCLDSLRKGGFEWKADKNGVRWCFERYVRPRFTEPDEKGNVILDMCFYVK